MESELHFRRSGGDAHDKTLFDGLYLPFRERRGIFSRQHGSGTVVFIIVSVSLQVLLSRTRQLQIKRTRTGFGFPSTNFIFALCACDLDACVQTEFELHFRQSNKEVLDRMFFDSSLCEECLYCHRSGRCYSWRRLRLITHDLEVCNCAGDVKIVYVNHFTVSTDVVFCEFYVTLFNVSFALQSHWSELKEGKYRHVKVSCTTDLPLCDRWGIISRQHTAVHSCFYH